MTFPPRATGGGVPPFTFVTDGAIEEARAIAGDRDVSVTGGDIGGQALATGLVDEVHMSVVPVVFGFGRRFFGSCDGGRVMLDDPRIVRGDRVTHLAYPVRTRITSGGSPL